MINPTLELERLNYTLQRRGMQDSDVRDFCDQAEEEINVAIMDIVADSLEQVYQAGAEAGATDFISQIRVEQTGHTFYITTDTGKWDFSTQPMEMRDKLLKNADIAEDGSRYKVIPMRGKSGTAQSTFEAGVRRQVDLGNLRDHARERGRGRRSSQDPLSMAKEFAGLAKGMKSPKKEANLAQSAPEYRTVTDKQSSATQWVRPGKDMDMTSVIMDVNRRLDDRIDSAIIDIIRKYGG